MLQLTDFISAYNKISNKIYKTPLEKSDFFSDQDKTVYLKLENQQKTKSFKMRGALNKISTLSNEEKERGVLAVSSGNHGIAVSCAAKLSGIKNTVIFVPTVTPKSKIDKIKSYGADVKIIGDNYDEMSAIGMKYLKDNNMTFVDPYNSDYDVYHGQGTISLEILLERPEIDTLIVPVSGGGLVTGVGIAAKKINPNIKIIGVQTESCPAFVKSFSEKVFYPEYPVQASVCEALMGGVGVEPYKWMYESMDVLVTVSEENIKKATKIAHEKEKIVIEPSAAVGLALFLEKPEIITGKHIAVIVTGGNINDDYLNIDFDRGGIR